ncbi:hypothetical protein [Anatilimnocola floriformis]|uniref:hypothetical protein n=1 Tax=Anatilimnocola floriformis TaxID=2948575 RepID=UPI0020C43016|nr:hypothetical protein [Anatilimnocola floriformis]
MFWFRKRPPKPTKPRTGWNLRTYVWGRAFLLTLIAAQVLYVAVVPPEFPLAPAGLPQVAGQEGTAEPEAFELTPFEKPPGDFLAQDAADISNLEASNEAAKDDPRWQSLTNTELDSRTSEEFAADKKFLTGRLLESITSADQHSAEENQDRLKEMTGQLNQVATAESVEQVSAHLSKLLSTGARATTPSKEPVPGEFDTETAQLHDVRREMLADGTFKYIAILIDAAGRTQEAELPAAEGESAFKTFELIKQNPLLERVYRGVVMSLLDKMLKPTP